MKTTIFKVKDMHCNSCSKLIEEKLKDYVKSVKASYSKETVEVEYDSDKTSEKQLIEKIKDIGYSVKSEEDSSTDKFGYWFMIGSFVVLAIFLYYIAKSFNIEIPSAGQNTGYILLFLVGILTSFHCVSMCGAFIVSYTTKNAAKGHSSILQHIIYGGAKAISYAVIGGLFGLVGGLFAFSIGLRGFISVLAGLFMIFYSLSMFNLKFFKRFQFNSKFLTKLAQKGTKKAKGPYFSPLIMGLLGGLFIACGPLQAMYLYAMGTSSFMTGFFSLLAFGLGTLPVLIIFGSLVGAISRRTTKKILKISAIIVLILGLIMVNRGLNIWGSDYTYESIKDRLSVIDEQSNRAIMKGDYQEINMNVDRFGWSPDSFVLQEGVPVKWKINVKELTGCNNEIIVKDYGLSIKLKQGINIIEFIPTESGTVRWSCWMGMIPGSFTVTADGTATQQQIQASAPVASGGCGG